MGLIQGTYDSKEKGFVPGGSSLHNCMSAHGPDAQAYSKMIQAHLTPKYQANQLAFMFESQQALIPEK
jgi:homogentisate 1,2-dioxygenase